MLAADYRKRARQALTGRWWQAALVGIIVSILGGNYASGSVTITRNFGDGVTSGDWSSVSDSVSSIGDVWYWIAAIGGIFALLFFLLSLTVGSVVNIGSCHYHTKLVLNQDQNAFSTVFRPFSYFGKAFGLRVMIFIRTLLWTILFFFPGIIAMYSYSMAPYIMAQNPDISISEAINQSKRLMIGNRFRLFCLHLSFIGWAILAAIPFGLGYVLLNPYISTAVAAFYADLSGQHAVGHV